MSQSFLSRIDDDFDPDGNVYDSLFAQYEKVVVQSLITSFGLDFIVRDQHGGDVDTIHNVRQIGKDRDMTYKNQDNAAAWDAHGKYDSREYHSHRSYIETNREVSRSKKAGTLVDGYTGERIGPLDKSDLDHIIAAKEIHDDPGRVLSGLNGADLANSPDNLTATSPRTNRTKKADSMDTFLEKYGDEYTQEQKDNMRRKDRQAREQYEATLASAYYTSPAFFRDSAAAACKTGALMGLRQALGLVFSEMWFAVRDRIRARSSRSESLFRAIGEGLKEGYANAQRRYREVMRTFVDGAISGVLSSVTTTLCNIFFTTAKNFIRIIRQTWASLVEAARIVFFNPDCLPFGERMRAAAKVIAAGASVVVGTMAGEMISATGIGSIPVVGEIVSTFCSTLVTGIMCCSLLYFLDRNAIINGLVRLLNSISPVGELIEWFREQSRLLSLYSAQLMQIDLERFEQETAAFNGYVLDLEKAGSQRELHQVLTRMQKDLGLNKPYRHETFDEFMKDDDAVLVFE